MSVGHRNERVRVYRYLAGSTDGFPHPTYPFVAERFARVTSRTSMENAPAGQPQHVTQVLVNFARAVAVPPNGVLKQMTTGRICRILSVEPRGNPGQEEWQVTAVWVDDLPAVALTGEPV